MRDIRDINKWPDVLSSDRRLSIVKMSIFSKLIVTLNVIKILEVCFVELMKIILKFIWEIKESRISEKNFAKNLDKYH